MHSKYFYPYTLLTPAYSTEPIFFLASPFHTIRLFSFCDPLNAAGAICVTTGLELSVRACLAHPLIGPQLKTVTPLSSKFYQESKVLH